VKKEGRSQQQTDTNSGPKQIAGLHKQQSGTNSESQAVHKAGAVSAFVKRRLLKSAYRKHVGSLCRFAGPGNAEGSRFSPLLAGGKSARCAESMGLNGRPTYYKSARRYPGTAERQPFFTFASRRKIRQ